MMSQIHWSVAVSSETDQSLRLFLASRGNGEKGELSRFVEEAVRSHILTRTAEFVKTGNAALGEDELSAMVVEAVRWARSGG
jgi:hypothetical protein